MTDSTRHTALRHDSHRDARRDRRPARRRPDLPPCIQWCDLRDGCLNCEQRIQWAGPLPSPDTLAALPGMMDRMHFAAVERSAAGLVRCEVRSGAVVCSLLARAAALRFSEPETDASESRVVHRWHISGGGLARRAAQAGSLGTIVFGWEATPGADGRADGHAEQALWARVEGYPSRFLRNPGGPRFWPPSPVSSIYAWYHGVVTCRYLRRMAAWMMDHAGDAAGVEDVDGG